MISFLFRKRSGIVAEVKGRLVSLVRIAAGEGFSALPEKVSLT